jgi:erythromycin esterase
MIGDSSLVALSEAAHGDAEPLEFRNRLFEYLVHEKSFTAIAIESGIVESRRVHDYVRGGDGDPASTMSDGISWTFDRYSQNAALVRWLREYNADPRHARKVNFYGFDVSGSPGIPRAKRGMDTALTETLRYIARVDPAAGTVLRAKLNSLSERLQFGVHCPLDARSYAGLSSDERDELTAAIADLLALLGRREADYVAASTVSDYEWAYRAAVGACQTDRWLRQIPMGWQPMSEPLEFPDKRLEFFSVANDVRDRAQADNLEWIVEREGPRGKVLIFGHRYHLSAAPVKAKWSAPGNGGGRKPQQVLGTYLRRRFGDRLVIIGSLAGGTDADSGAIKQTFAHPVPKSMDALARDLAVPFFLLDLRAAPPQVTQWLEQEHELTDDDDTFELELGKAFDVLLYIDRVTPACSV